MTRAEVFAAIKTMSTSDRLDLLDELWTSLERDDFVPEMTSELKSLLDERIAHADAHPDDVVTWEAMKAAIHAERSRE